MRLLMLAAAFALVAIGVLNIYAVGHPSAQQPDTITGVVEPAEPAVENGDPARQETIIEPHRLADEWKKQVVFAAAGVFCLVFVNLFNYTRLGPISYLLYGIMLVLLTVLLVDKVIDLPFVPYINNSRRWIKLGFGFQVQPSEFCKIAYILALAWYLRFRSNYRKLLGLIGPFALTLLAMVLILLEPDLGTVMLMMPILFSMLFVAGAKVKHLLLILFLGLAVSPFLWHSMHSYQRIRISSVLLQNEKVFRTAEAHPKLAEILVGDPDHLRTWSRDRGYHLIHSKKAITSGGLYGYGFAKGPYIQYGYLPERHNDFIFATIAHQFGLLGCGVVLILYVIILACAIELAFLNTDPFGRLVAVGIAAMFAVQVLVNVGMTLGLMPITGLTLPLVSYGGSSLVVNFIAIGLLNNIGKHRPFSVAKRPFEFD
jgi:rod shape determining protein RodA